MFVVGQGAARRRTVGLGVEGADAVQVTQRPEPAGDVVVLDPPVTLVRRRARRDPRRPVGEPMFLSDLSIKQPVFATMMMVALAVLGIASYRQLRWTSSRTSSSRWSP